MGEGQVRGKSWSLIGRASAAPPSEVVGTSAGAKEGEGPMRGEVMAAPDQ